MLAAGMSAAALAAGSYLVVRHNLLADSVDAAARQTRRNLVIAPTYLRTGPDALLAAYERGGDFLTVGVEEGRPFSSSFSVGLRQVPPGVRRLVAEGRLMKIVTREDLTALPIEKKRETRARRATHVRAEVANLILRELSVVSGEQTDSIYD